MNIYNITEDLSIVQNEQLISTQPCINTHTVPPTHNAVRVCDVERKPCGDSTVVRRGFPAPLEGQNCVKVCLAHVYAICVYAYLYVPLWAIVPHKKA